MNQPNEIQWLDGSRSVIDQGIIGEDVVDNKNEWLSPDTDLGISMRWLLIRSKKQDGIRLAVPEDSGWRLIDEKGNSSWAPQTLHVLAVMPMFVPTDVPYEAEDDA